MELKDEIKLMQEKNKDRDAHKIPCPSKYHSRSYTGTTPSGYVWSYNSSHDDLEPTKIIVFNNNHYCAYCGETAYPIQAGLRNKWGEDKTYAVTGYTCICEIAELEKKMRKEIKEEEEQYNVKINKIENKYKTQLKTNFKAIKETVLKRISKDFDGEWMSSGQTYSLQVIDGE